MMNFIRNFTANAMAATKTEAKLVAQLAKIHGIDVDSIKSEQKYINTKDTAYGEGHSIESKELSITFRWLGHKIEIHTDARLRIMISEVTDNGLNEIGYVCWSAEDGMFHTRQLIGPKWVNFLVAEISRACFNVSSKMNDKIAFNDKLTINACEIWSDGYARVMITNNKTKEVNFLIGIDPWGRVTWNSDLKYSKYVSIVKKLFTKIMK